MSQMIRSFGEGANNELCASAVSVAQALKWLSDAQRVLREHGRAALKAVIEIPDNDVWGVEVKRQKVNIPGQNSPILNEEDSAHNLVEVFNMCATLERLIDALDWVSKESSFDSYEVEHCHPTTGANQARRQAGEADNDLVLKSGREPKMLFEVSDVIGAGGPKFKKDLRSLGALDENATATSVERWPKARLFIVSSNNPPNFLGLEFVHVAASRNKLRPTLITEVKPTRT